MKLLRQLFNLNNFLESRKGAMWSRIREENIKKCKARSKGQRAGETREHGRGVKN